MLVNVTLNNILGLVPEEMEICLNHGDFVLRGTMDSMQSLLSEPALTATVANIEARADVLWVWLASPRQSKEDT